MKPMKSEGRMLAKATPAMARSVWEAQQRPSVRTVARALRLAGYPIHFSTVGRWKAQGWRSVRSDHPLDVARSQLEAVTPIVTGDPKTRLDDIIGVPEGKDLDQSADGELLRKATRELAIATTLIARAIKDRVVTSDFDLLKLTPALLAVGQSLRAIPEAFDQVIDLQEAEQRTNQRRQT
jgi:hypothetical protein